MPLDTGIDELNEAIEAQLREMSSPSAREALLGRTRIIRESATHDFSRYEFMLDPTHIRFTGAEGGSGIGDVGIPAVDYGTWLDFERFVDGFNTEVAEYVEGWFWRNVTHWVEVDDDYVREYPISGQERERHIQGVILSGRNGFRLGMAPELYRAYTQARDKGLYYDGARVAVSAWLESRLRTMRTSEGRMRADDFYQIQTAAFWSQGVPSVLVALEEYLPDEDAAEEGAAPDLGEAIPGNFSFDPFLPHTVNFGLQFIYRQSWVPMGTQPGEIVRTLPLGPKQSEKISIKNLRRLKSSRQSELVRAIESTTESTVASKDSSEVVQEASESFNWHVEASASANFGFGSASLTAGMGGENASSSRDTKSQLNETMEKSASRIRNESKIVISTERETTDEFSQTSEISNPNEEIAVTYIYSRLQRQYEITTYLSEVNSVLFVAEEVPAPRDISGAWIRRYDWIIARNLLDESFREDLNVVRANAALSALDDEGIDTNIKSLMESFSNGSSPGLPDYSGLPGQVPDIFQTPQNAYEREVERRRARQAELHGYRRSLIRLRGHIYDNVLHYCRAIWSAEDPDTRRMRYAKIRVPTRWEFVATSSPGSHAVEGYWAPAVRDPAKDTAAVADMIHGPGPIGFAGNYSVFFLRPDSRWRSLEAALRFQKTPYLYFGIEVTPTAGEWPDGSNVETAVNENRLDTGRYRIRFNAELKEFHIFQENSGGAYTHVETATLQGNMLQFHALRLWFNSPELISNEAEFNVNVYSLPKLVDPEVKYMRWQHDQPVGDEQERAFYTPEVMAAFAEQFAAVRRSLERHDMEALSWDELSDVSKQVMREHFYEYRLREEHTRRLVLDTDNLILTREVDTASSLEPFKGLHRLADVLKVFEEVDDLRSENLRKRARLHAGQLGDPDIDKLTVIAGEDLAGIVALDRPDDDDPET